MGMARRVFLGAGVGAGFGLMGGRAALGRQPAGGASPGDSGSGDDAAWSATTEWAVAREVVGKSHSDLDAVRGLVEAHPELACSAVDWGFGDWETALGAASHVGRRDIAEYLISKGARPDLFTHAMLGHLAVVRAAVEAMPSVARIKGPHGFTLAHHARVGGEGSMAVAEYLASVEGSDEVAVSAGLDEATGAAIAGRYVFVGGAAAGAAGGGVRPTAPSGWAEIAVGRRGMEFRGPGGLTRPLIAAGSDGGWTEFHPSGTPSVRLRFSPGAGKMELRMGGGVFEARRAVS